MDGARQEGGRQGGREGAEGLSRIAQARHHGREGNPGPGAPLLRSMEQRVGGIGALGSLAGGGWTRQSCSLKNINKQIKSRLDQSLLFFFFF